MPNIELLHIDCMEYMATLPDKAFDLAIVDPPYGITEKSYRKVPSKKAAAKKKDYNMNLWNCGKPTDEYWDELMRVSKNQIVWGGNYFTNNLYESRCWIIWDKCTQDSLFADVEMAWTSWQNSAKLFTYRWNGMLQQDMKNKEERVHPTQKPIALYKWILQNYGKRKCNHKHTEQYNHLCSECKTPMKILDTHGGSRSLAIACHQMGFDHVSCEIDLDYHNDSVKRFKEQTMQQSLFTP